VAKAKKATRGRSTARKAAKKGSPRPKAGRSFPAKAPRRQPASAGTKPAAAPAPERVAEFAGVSDETVAERTGRRWVEWLAILDDKAAIELPATAIARWLHNAHGLDGWWAQTVTAGYQQARGLREGQPTPAGFEVVASRTVGATPEACFTAFSNGKLRRRFLQGAPTLELRAADKPRTIRFVWGERGAWFEVRFFSKRAGRTVVTVQHGGLSSSAEGVHLQSWWGEALARLAAAVGS
jgi:hypothetical protein